MHNFHYSPHFRRTGNYPRLRQLCSLLTHDVWRLLSTRLRIQWWSTHAEEKRVRVTGLNIQNVWVDFIVVH